MIEPADIGAATRAVDRRWSEGESSLLDRLMICDEELVAAHLRLAADGVTHDERLIELYVEESA